MKIGKQSNRLGLFDDVRQILDAALQSGGGEAQCPTHGQAVHWRQRAYQFRKLYAQMLASDDSFSMSPYDKLTMPQIPDDSSTVIINVRESIATFTPNRELYAPIEVPIPGDELFDVAKGIAEKIKEGGL